MENWIVKTVLASVIGVGAGLLSVGFFDSKGVETLPSSNALSTGVENDFIEDTNRGSGRFSDAHQPLNQAAVSAVKVNEPIGTQVSRPELSVSTEMDVAAQLSSHEPLKLGGVVALGDLSAYSTGTERVSIGQDLEPDSLSVPLDYQYGEVRARYLGEDIAP